MNIENKSLNLAVKVKMLDDSDGEGTFEGRASTEDLDYHNDVVPVTAFKDSLKACGYRVKMLWHHEERELPIGMADLKMMDDHIYFKGRLNATTRAKEVHMCLKEGSLDEMSIGFWKAEPVWKTGKDGEPYRFIEKLELREISPVNFAANPNCKVTGVKSIRDLEAGFRDESGLSHREAKTAAVIFNAVVEQITNGDRDDPSSSQEGGVNQEAKDIQEMLAASKESKRLTQAIIHNNTQPKE